MTWPALPDARPWSPVERRGVRRIDAEFYGKTVVDQLLASGAVVLGGGLDMDGSAISDVGSVDFRNNGSNPTESDGPDQYPEGWSYNLLSAASWPVATGWVETFIDTSASRAYQAIRPKNASYSLERFYATATTWSDWRLTQPRKVRDATSTQYDIVAASTPETARTVTIWGSPPSNFQAEIHVTWQMWVQNPTAACNNRAYVSISRDGGSTWTSGLKQLDHISGAGEFGSLTVHALASGPVTGDIQARLTVQSSHADTKYDDMDLIATFGANY